MFDIKLLLDNQVQDEWGNVHFVVDNQIVASFLKNSSFTCRVNIEVVYDEKWTNVYIDHNGPVVVVYSFPIDVVDSVPETIKKMNILATYCVTGAINGVAFRSDLMPFGWQSPVLPTAQSSDVEMDGDIDYDHKLAKDLFTQMTQQLWDFEAVEKYRAEQDFRLIS